MIAKVESACLMGLDASRVLIEVSLAKGLPCFSIVGLPDAAIREAKDRVVSAVRNSGFEFPSRRVTINLSPAELKKEGAAFDLAIAVGVLLAHEAIQPKTWPRCIWLGELALDGGLQPVRGALALVKSLSQKGWTQFVIPEANAREAACLQGVSIYPFASLKEVAGWLEGSTAPRAVEKKQEWKPAAPSAAVDLCHVKGQAVAKRALEIAAAGSHNILFVGPPGTGKSMLAQTLPALMPRWSFEEALEATQVHSLSGLPEAGGILLSRPFRSPHHTVSTAALIGGGDFPAPGEISLAHRGVLFLDELPEFRRDVLEALRQPLEEGIVHVQRVRGRAVFPAEFLLIAAMNPCPCGHRGHPKKECICSPLRIRKYLSKISAPLLDRIDLHVELPVLSVEDLLTEDAGAEASEAVQRRVESVRVFQTGRFAGHPLHEAWNARLRGAELKKHCSLDAESKNLLKTAIERLGLSARAFDRIRRVARTIADFGSSPKIQAAHIAEAIQYRALDRQREFF